MTFIGKEVPTGVIDGVNTVFTLLNDVDFIDDIFMDGAVYISYSIIGKVLTLTDAPIVSILVDYNTGTTTIPVTTDCTFGEIKQKVWDLTGQKSTSTNFSPTIVGDEINNRAIEIWKGRVANKLNPKELFRAGGLYFRDKVINVRILSGGKLTEELLVGDTEATLADTTNLLSAGYVEIGGDTISYTNKTDTTLEGVLGQTTNHLESERVIQLYEMPVDMDKPKQLEKVIQGNSLRKADIPLDNTDTFGTYYQIVRPSNTQILLKIVGLCNDDLVKVSYPKKYQKMTSNTDLCPFPEQYGITVVAYIVAGSLGYDKGIPNSQQWLNSGYTSLQTMYGDFNDEINIVKQTLKPKAYKMSSINRGISVTRIR